MTALMLLLLLLFAITADFLSVAELLLLLSLDVFAVALVFDFFILAG